MKTVMVSGVKVLEHLGNSALSLDCYLYQHVREPTKENNIIDLLIFLNELMVSDVKVLEHLGNRDHNIIIWDVIYDFDLSKNKEPYRQLNKADFVSMRQWFMNIYCNTKFKDLPVEEAWHNLSLIKQLISLYL